MPSPDRYSIDAFARSCALDLIKELRASKHINKEQLFADAVIFYRWFLPRMENKDEYERYWKLFCQEHPRLAQKLDAPLRMACFVTWFRENLYGILPLSEQGEQE